MECFFTESFQEKIEICFRHRKDFGTLPGSCLFMMAVETCNASVFLDVEGDKKKLEALDLHSFPGKSVTNLAGKAQQLLKIMAGAYAVPVNIGSTLLRKLTHTSSEIFTCNIFALLDEVMTLESEYDLKDPCLLAKDENHQKYGPLALVATIEASHGLLLSRQRWPALSASLPQSNTSSVSTNLQEREHHLSTTVSVTVAKVITLCATVLFPHQRTAQALLPADLEINIRSLPSPLEIHRNDGFDCSSR